jgi:hypothetical protein
LTLLNKSLHLGTATKKAGAPGITNMKEQNKNGTYQIEKGVPMPVFASRKFPLAEMKPGESFALSADKKEVRTARNAIHRLGKGRFVIRKWEKAYRCWCIK